MSKKLTREQMMEKAVANLQKLKVTSAYINALKNKGVITMFIQGFGYFVDKDTEDNLLQEIKRVEKEYGGLVYGVVKYRIESDTVYGLLYISPYAEDFSPGLMPSAISRVYYGFCYAYNASYDYNSEFGDIPIYGDWGGIKIYCGR